MSVISGLIFFRHIDFHNPSRRLSNSLPVQIFLMVVPVEGSGMS